MVELAWPIVVIQLLQVAYNLADTFWLGQFSGNAVAAISLAFPLVFFLISVGGGFTTAGSILVAQFTGADSEGSAGKVAAQTLGFVVSLSAVLGVVGHFVTGDMLALLPADPETAALVVPKAAEYMEVFFLGMPALFGFFVFSSLMRGYGNTRTPMIVMFVSVAINVILDPFLIFGYGPFPEMGIAGAAVATIFARAVAAVIGVYVLFYTNAGPEIELSQFYPDFSMISRIVRVGTPSAAEQSTTALAMITLTAMVASFPPAVVGAFGLGNRLISLVFLPAMGLGRATNTMVGQNLGAKNTERAERAVWLAAKFAAAVLFGVAIVAAVFPEPIVSVFLAPGSENAAEIIDYGTTYLRIRSVEFVFVGILQVMLGAFRGAGNTKTSMVISMIALWLGRVPTVYVFAFVLGWGATGIWVGMALGNIVGAIAAALWFTRGTWKNTIVDADDDESDGDSDTPPEDDQPDPA
ncbi:MATE family efflux transporter [Halobacterium jilantaiense]|uniref:Multidrug-efflux transporter n=1 Tax=Halobacterium jilantaiense TaxID=355548 RepID=A0A1I0PHP7_9EURY|nr:MATE family efflux transporter [Halobacterium jilantaiense]SEW13237.1 putative efflux protein, MATE family [Halobacterium jilantaiense]